MGLSELIELVSERIRPDYLLGYEHERHVHLRKKEVHAES